MIRTEYLRSVGGYNESYNCQDGYELWVKFTQHFKISNLNQPLFFYRQHGNNLTSNENRILDTRAKINEHFVNEFQHNTKTLAIIPVRGGKNDLAFKTLNGKNLLKEKIRELEKSKNIEKIVISSPDQKVEELLSKLNKKHVFFHKRALDQARLNKSLDETVLEILQLMENQEVAYDSVALITLEYPFLKAYKIDDAIHTLFIFGADSLIGVRPDNSIFYQHHGDGLHPILNREKYTKLEREALFKQTGGISIVKTSSLRKSKTVINGMLGHIVLDQISSIGLFSDEDFKIAELLIRQKNESTMQNS
jgi:CMP-N-acetylneuraminic acid synthetase